MVTSTFIAIMIGLSILSIVDYLTYDKKKGYIPSILTTTFLLVMFIISNNIFMAITSALLGLALTDFNLWKGIADYKVYVAVSMSMLNPLNLLVFTLIMTLTGFVTSWIIRKASNQTEIPYIPIIMAGWCFSLWLL